MEIIIIFVTKRKIPIDYKFKSVLNIIALFMTNQPHPTLKFHTDKTATLKKTKIIKTCDNLVFHLSWTWKQ